MTVSLRRARLAVHCYAVGCCCSDYCVTVQIYYSCVGEYAAPALCCTVAGAEYTAMLADREDRVRIRMREWFIRWGPGACVGWGGAGVVAGWRWVQGLEAQRVHRASRAQPEAEV